MDVRSLFARKAAHRVWKRLDDSHVVGRTSGEDIVLDRAYFVFRVTEMYLRHSRKLWRKTYPMLHAFVEFRDEEEHAVAGPGQLRQIDDPNLDRVMVFNYPLAGPTPYLEEEIHLLVGLYSVPGKDVARALLDSVIAVAGLANIGVDAARKVIDIVRGGVESILNLDSTTLQLGVSDHFYANNALRSGYHLAIAAPVEEIDFGKLWLVGGRLFKGSRPESSLSYIDHDYMVIEVERRLSRDDWPRLREIASFQDRFEEILKAGGSTEDRKHSLKILRREFDHSVRTSEELISPDKTLILKSVYDDLVARIQHEPDFAFESSGWGGVESVRTRAAEFDFVNVGDTVDTGSPVMVAEADRVLERILEEGPWHT